MKRLILFLSLVALSLPLSLSAQTKRKVGGTGVSGFHILGVSIGAEGKIKPFLTVDDLANKDSIYLHYSAATGAHSYRTQMLSIKTSSSAVSTQFTTFAGLTSQIGYAPEFAKLKGEVQLLAVTPLAADELPAATEKVMSTAVAPTTFFTLEIREKSDSPPSCPHLNFVYNEPLSITYCDGSESALEYYNLNQTTTRTLTIDDSSCEEKVPVKCSLTLPYHSYQARLKWKKNADPSLLDTEITNPGVSWHATSDLQDELASHKPNTLFPGLSLACPSYKWLDSSATGTPTTALIKTWSVETDFYNPEMDVTQKRPVQVLTDLTFHQNGSDLISDSMGQVYNRQGFGYGVNYLLGSYYNYNVVVFTSLGSNNKPCRALVTISSGGSTNATKDSDKTILPLLGGLQAYAFLRSHDGVLDDAFKFSPPVSSGDKK